MVLAPKGSSRFAPYLAALIGLLAVLFFWFLRYWIVLETDITVYKDTFSNSVKFDAYYVKEFAFWFPAWFFESLLGAEFALFALDLIYLACLFAFYFKYPNLGPGWIVIVLFSFPSVIGFSNTFRQHLATALFVTGVFVGPRILIFSSIFLHNIVLFFSAPYFPSGNKVVRFIVTVTVYIGLMAYIVFLDDRSGGQTGGDNRFYLGAICVALGLGLVFIHQFKVSRSSLVHAFLGFSLGVALIQNEIFFERLMIFICGCLCFVYAVSCSRIDSRLGSQIVKVWLYFLCVTPVNFMAITDRISLGFSEFL